MLSQKVIFSDFIVLLPSLLPIESTAKALIFNTKLEMKKLYYTFLISLIFQAFAEAQLPTVGDCLGAIPICSTYYDEPDPYIWAGTGNYPNEIYRSKECMINELNGMWYTFTSLNDGLLRFVITPHDSLTDYDWNVFDITIGSCENLKTDSHKYLISSNTYGAFQTTTKQSLTGANTSISGGSGNCNGPGIENGPAWNDDIRVYQNHIYLIYISNWSGSKYGYSIDFSASTADIWDRKPPELTNLHINPICGQKNLNILFSENIICSKIRAEAFNITDSKGNKIDILTINSPICESGGTYAREFNLELNKELIPENYTLIYSDTLCDICGNETVADSIVFAIDSLKLEVSKQDIDCAGNQNGRIAITSNQKVDTVFYSIDGINFYADQLVFDQLDNGIYTITAKNQFSCQSKTEIIEIIEPESLKMDITKTDVMPCKQSNNGTISILTSGGTLPYKYSLNTTNDFNSTQNFNNLEGGNYLIYTKDAKDCILSDTIEIVAPNEIKICLKEIQHLTCFQQNDGILEIECTENNKILWTTGDTTSLIQNLGIGIYKITATNQFGCNYSVSYEITQPEKLILSKTQENVNCFGQSTGKAEISVSGGTPDYKYLWSNNSKSTKILNLPFGEYWVNVLDNRNCSVSDTIFISQAPQLNLSLSAEAASSTIIPDGQIFTSITGGTPFYEMTIRAQNTRPPYDLNALYSDLYTIYIIDSKGCSISDTISVLAKLLDSQIEVPNVFTPNSDGINDIFLLKAYGLRSFSGVIVNRWGRQVYAWNNPNDGWDGTINHSSDASEGVYFYVIKAVGMDNKNYLLNGSFHLVR